MARSSAEVAALTRRRVLDHAIEMFDRNGFAGTALDDVARAASVTRGAVYHHFVSKKGLFVAVMEALQAEVAQEVERRAHEAGDSALDQLRAGSHAFVDAITRQPRLKILLIDAPAVVGWRTWRDHDAAHSMRHLREGLEQVGVPEALLDAVTVQLSGAMNEAALWVAEHDGDELAREKTREALDVLIDALARYSGAHEH